MFSGEAPSAPTECAHQSDRAERAPDEAGTASSVSDSCASIHSIHTIRSTPCIRLWVGAHSIGAHVRHVAHRSGARVHSSVACCAHEQLCRLHCEEERSPVCTLCATQGAGAGACKTTHIWQSIQSQQGLYTLHYFPILNRLVPYLLYIIL